MIGFASIEDCRNLDQNLELSETLGETTGYHPYDHSGVRSRQLVLLSGSYVFVTGSYDGTANDIRNSFSIKDPGGTRGIF